MSPEYIGILGIVVLLLLMAGRMWIGATMILVGFAGIYFIRGWDQALSILATRSFVNIAFYSISVIPMFVLMGNIVAEAGIGTDLYDTAYKWVGQFRGGLAMASVFASTLLAAITGISSAALVTMGKVALPEMKRYKYDERLATGCIAIAGTLAFLIPPSLAFIMYGIFTEQSVGLLFIAGILPGILLAALFIITIVVYTAFRPTAGPPGPKTTFKEKMLSLKNTWHVILLFLLVLGGIYGGIFTPTEAGAVGAFGSVVITVATRRLTVKSFYASLKESVLMTAMIFLIIAGAFVFIYFMAVSRLPLWLGDVITGLEMPRMLIFLGIVVVYIILGMFLDIMASVILTIPIIFPVVVGLGFDPIWFGVIIVILIELGLVTPPVGMDVFVLSGLTGTPVGTIFRGVWPFCIAALVCIVILTIFPQIATFLPYNM